MELNINAENYFKELHILYTTSGKRALDRNYTLLYQCLNRFTQQAVSIETIQFSNLFSRLSFLCYKYNISGEIHNFRVVQSNLDLHSQLQLHLCYNTYWSDVNNFIAQVSQHMVPLSNQSYFALSPQRIELEHHKFLDHYDSLKVTVVYQQFNTIGCVSEKFEDTIFKVKINEIGVNEFFTDLDKIAIGEMLYLIDVGVDENLLLYPHLIVVSPDYLIDVSSISECFQDYGHSALQYIKNKFQRVAITKHILIGHFANLVIDQLVGKQQNELSFDQVFQQHFEQLPYEHLFCSSIHSSEDFLNYAQDCRAHFQHIVRVVYHDFVTYGLNGVETIALEPSFVSPMFGLQGRMDILQQPCSIDQPYVIVELKSGSGPYPDSGINIKDNHANQLFMYYMLLGAVKGFNLEELAKLSNITGYIFYSKVGSTNLRNDHITLDKMQQICQMRNQIIFQEQVFQRGSGHEISCLVKSVQVDNLVKYKISPKFKELLALQFGEVTKPFYSASSIEWAYFYSFCGFISREQQRSKSGDNNILSSESLASLWNLSFEQKVEQHRIMHRLVIDQNMIDTAFKKIVFKREVSDELVSFRTGDVCVLYPMRIASDSVINSQIFKCTIADISPDKLEVVFRYQQGNTHFFNAHHFWALERDAMDANFSSMYKNLYDFIRAPKYTKELLLTIASPKKGIDYGYHNANLSIEQNRILNNALSCEDYFILNGPPGTGKTSHIIKELIKELYHQTPLNVLVLAYTNKAVDELGTAVKDALLEQELPFIRIGNALSCSDEFVPYLMDEVVLSKNRTLQKRGKKLTRKIVAGILSEQRIFLSTVSTMAGRGELLDYKNFDVVIIDEASQILEPQIIGILSKVKRFIMIGDHKQLPAIVLQDQVQTKIEDKDLQSIGLHSMHNSLFERLYTFCEMQGFDYAFDTLTYQGRMHRDIAAFVNNQFYNGKLKQAYDLSHLSVEVKQALYRQVSPLRFEYVANDKISQALSKSRILFFHCKASQPLLGKSNDTEARRVVEIVEKLIFLYKSNGRELNVVEQIGIIAPFKNQIALIREELHQRRIDDANKITIDTVERFQGGQKDFIIYSFTATELYQLKALINLNDIKDVDRKLNVALTRAKEQMILVGDGELLKKDPLYNKLFTHLQQHDSLYVL